MSEGSPHAPFHPNNIASSPNDSNINHAKIILNVFEFRGRYTSQSHVKRKLAHRQVSRLIHLGNSSLTIEVKPPRRTPSGIRKLPKPSGSPAVVHPAPSPTIPTGTSAKRRRTSKSLDKSEAPAPSLDLPQNLTHTAQSSLPESVLASDPVTTAEEAGEEDGWPGYPGWSDEEVFRRVSRPDEIPGQENWGIPDEVDAGECDDSLKVSSDPLTISRG